MEECVEENQQQSDHHSFGTVRDEERLARFVWRSDHLAGDGELAPAAFPVQDLLEHSRGGLSVARLEHMTGEEVRRRVDALVDSTSAHRTKGLAVAEAKGIRAIRKSGVRQLCVIDDGLPDFQAHAVTRLANHQSMSRSSVRRVRERLMHTFAFQPSNQ